jgi:non-specific serine/threonine protein kinase
MQYVEGEILANRIQRNPMLLRDVLDIAVQVTDALAEAHSRGIIHRDIKPQNIIVTPRGQAKVMDFGLARIVQQTQATGSQAGTQSLLTEPGTVVGTVRYMSPEQLRGDTVDARSDIFSFGAVLYEMMSGRQPFAAENPAAIFSAILTREPAPLARYSSEVPVELQRIVNKVLNKDREESYQTAKDLLVDLKILKQGLEIEAKLERPTHPALDSEAAVRPSPPAVDTAKHASLTGEVARRNSILFRLSSKPTSERCIS